MGVPLAAGTAIKLHETDPPLDEAAGQEAHPSEALRLLLIEAVERLRLCCLILDIDRFGRFGLHAEGELVTGDAGFELALAGPLGGMCLVEPLEQVQLLPLLGVRDALRRSEEANRLRPTCQRRSLIAGGHESGGPVSRAVDDLAGVVLHHHERGQVLVLRPQAVADPGPQRRPAADGAAGVHLADAAGMVQAVGPAGADDAQVVRTGRRLRQPVGNPQAPLAVLLPLAGRIHDGAVVLPHRQDHRLESRRHRLAVELLEQRLGIERVEMAGATFHEEEDDGFGSRGNVGSFGGQRAGRREDGSWQQVRKGQAAKAGTGGEEHLAAGDTRRI